MTRGPLVLHPPFRDRLHRAEHVSLVVFLTPRFPYAGTALLSGRRH